MFDNMNFLEILIEILKCLFFSWNFSPFRPPFEQITSSVLPCHMKGFWQGFLASVCSLRIIEFEERGNWYPCVKPRKTEGSLSRGKKKAFSRYEGGEGSAGS